MKLKGLIFFLFFASTLFAQHDWRIAQNTSPLETVERIELPQQDNDQLLEEEMERRGPGIAPRFAVTFPVNITPDTHGSWDYTESGKAVWRLKIYSKDAKSLNFGFTKYFMPAGGMLVIYSTDLRTIHGPFTPADNEEHEELWTPVFPDEEIVIEVQVPAENKSLLQLELKSINHDFLGFGAVVSGSCNLDVICDATDGWGIVDNYRDIIQSVAVIGMNGGTFCTGFLINNANQDCAPYFMTANHCGVNNGNASSLVAYWNFQNSTCREPGSAASGQNGNGNLNNFNSGAFFRASYGPSDFTLVEFDDPVSESADGFYAGWSIENIMPSDTIICIHHPSTDEKRISFEFNPAQPGNGLNQNVVNINNATHVIIQDWDIGTTEGGSSGSPLFNKEKQVVGQLHGGAAACGNNAYDTYGWFRASWFGGGNNNNRLSNWLDPNDTGITELDGIEVINCSFNVEVAQSNVQACPGDTDAIFTITPSFDFSADVNLSVSGLPAGTNFSFSTNPVSPGQTTTLTISGINTLTIDDYILNLNATDNQGSAFEILVLSIVDTPVAPNLAAPADNSTGNTLNQTFVWNNVQYATSYFVELALDPAFTNIVDQVTSTNNFQNFPSLTGSTTYYWRVTAINNCGQMASSVFNFTTIQNLSVSLSPGSIALCNTESAQFNLSIGSDFSASGANISATNLPTGATINYSQNPAIPGTPVTLTIENLQGTPSGSYSVTITVEDGQNTNSNSVTLLISSAPEAVGLTNPTDNQVEVDLTPQFLWVPSDEADEYTLEIATDANFTNIIDGTTTNITIYNTTADLQDNTVYYWRVVANGDCGTTPSEVRSFTTIIINDIGELNNTKVDIRPNPTNGLVNITLAEPLPGNLAVDVFSINGQRLIHQIKTGETSIDVSLKDYPSGVYLLKLVNDQNVLTRRIIVQK